MKKYYTLQNSLLMIMALIASVSCTKYNISGTSTLQNVDGRMIYLRGLVGDKIVDIDSCEMVHGKFKFSGSLDSVQVVTLCIDDYPMIPVVLEDGEVIIELNDGRQTCKGTPLNDTLTAFNLRYETLMTKFDELEHRQSQAIMNGEDIEAVNQQIEMQHGELIMQEDKMVSAFISDNFDNCLGAYVFQMATSAYKYPILTPWIEALMTKATDTFKNSPYVKEYMQMAKQNQDIMTGMAEAPQPTPTLPPNQLPAPPTPNEMAKPQE
ncbi:MAG: DUF4369 domain-containing protein [Prevotella sp.]|jgi:hypothetical protein|nr:DUF4369 domain-containing protein [Prevotella sp.]